MSILPLLASSQGLKSDEPNIQLAHSIAKENNQLAIKELIENLKGTNKNIQSDCIKILYEIGYLNPTLISDYYLDFLEQLSSKNNRMVWGSMIAISNITEIKHKEIFSSFNIIIETINSGSVITIDCGVEILSKLNMLESYTNTIEPLLIEQLWRCPIKQLPMYSEKAIKSITKRNSETYKDLIKKRIVECEKESQKARLNKMLKILDSK